MVVYVQRKKIGTHWHKSKSKCTDIKDCAVLVCAYACYSVCVCVCVCGKPPGEVLPSQTWAWQAWDWLQSPPQRSRCRSWRPALWWLPSAEQTCCRKQAVARYCQFICHRDFPEIFWADFPPTHSINLGPDSLLFPCWTHFSLITKVQKRLKSRLLSFKTSQFL